MNISKHGIKALGLTLPILLGMLALSVNSVQAQTHEEELHKIDLHDEALHEYALEYKILPLSTFPGTYLINLEAALLASFDAEQEGVGFLLIPSRDYKIECQNLSIEVGKINTSTDAFVKVKFLGCLTFSLSTGEHLTSCEFKTLKTITAEALVLPVIHNGESFLLFEAPEGSPNFVVLSYKSGTGCPLFLSNVLNGSIAAQVDTKEGAIESILFSEDIQLLTGDIWAFGLNAAYIDGTAKVELSGEHIGQKLEIF